MKFSIGDTVGAYRILEELGRGGMGRVFKVEHTVTQRLEAMKVLEGGRPGAPEHAARSLREIQLQASLDHPNIAAVHNAFWVDEDLVLIMELIEGCSLRSRLESKRESLGTALDYARQALAALSYAHAHGVVHRDISPANMMIGPSGVLKLTDFGLAKGQADLRLSQSGAPLGSLNYMSPEQVRGTEADERSDIYSFGAVLYELTTGKKPFDGVSAFYIMSNQIDKPPVPPIEIEPSLPHPLNKAILRALEKDPAQRFPSAEEFLQALTCGPDPGNVSKSRSTLRLRAFWTVASVSAAALVLGGIVLSEKRHGLVAPSAAVVVRQSDGLRHEHETSAEAQPAVTPSSAPSRSVGSRRGSVTEKAVRKPSSSTVASRQRAHTLASGSEAIGVQPGEGYATATPPTDGDGVTTTKRGPNRFTRAITKIWHLGRHKKSSSESEEDTPPSSENP